MSKLPSYGAVCSLNVVRLIFLHLRILNTFGYQFYLFSLHLFIFLCECVNMPWCVCGDQKTTCGKSVLSFYHVGHKDWTQTENKGHYPLSCPHPCLPYALCGTVHDIIQYAFHVHKLHYLCVQATWIENNFDLYWTDFVLSLPPRQSTRTTSCTAFALY